MKLFDICRKAALYSERDDEYPTAAPATVAEYVDEAARYREIFVDAANDAYIEAAKKLGIPLEEAEVTPVDGRIALTGIDPLPIRIRRVEDAEAHYVVGYYKITEQEIAVTATRPVRIIYNYAPDPLVEDDDEPIFPDAQVDPLLYVFLAVARVYQSERKNDTAAPWEARYYDKLNKVKPVGSGKTRRLPRRDFR